MTTQPLSKPALAFLVLAIAILLAIAAGSLVDEGILPQRSLLIGAAQGQAATDRHPLETQALKDPQIVLDQVDGAILEAKNNPVLQSRLWLAKANACRVVARWACQWESAQAAVSLARTAKAPHLEARALILQSRAAIARQDYSTGQNLLGQAQRILANQPSSNLQADVNLAYSSLSFNLGELENSRKHAVAGLEDADKGDDLGIKVRLLRNLARAQAKLGEISAAQESLRVGYTIAEKLEDPKLLAELYLEAARLARGVRDVKSVHESVAKVFKLADQLKNSQLFGQAKEALGLLEIDQGNASAAWELLQSAQQSFQELSQMRDEHRVLRVLTPLALEINRPRVELQNLTKRMLDLGQMLEAEDRAKAIADFDMRLEFAKNQFRIQELEIQAKASSVQEKLLRKNSRLAFALALLALVLTLSMMALVMLQIHSRRKLTASELRLRSVTDNAPAGIAQFDSSENVVFANPALQKRFGTTQSPIGISLETLRGNTDYMRLQPEFRRALSGERVEFEDQYLVDDETRYERVTLVPDVAKDGSIFGFFAMHADITELKRAKLSLERMALVDSLTQLPNRRSFMTRRSQALSRSKRMQQGLAMVALDIDLFKGINDGFGHATGDAVLSEFAKRLLGCIRENDFAARLGGDEFIVLIEDVDSNAQGIAIAERLLAAMQEPFMVDERKLSVTTSIGVAFMKPVENADKLQEIADRALYQAKAQGRSAFAVLAA